MTHRLRVIEQALDCLVVPSEHQKMPATVSRDALSEMIRLVRCVCFPQYSGEMVNMRECTSNIGKILSTELFHGFMTRDAEEARGGSRVERHAELEPPIPIRYGQWVEPSNRREVLHQAAEMIVDEFLLCRLAKVKVLLQLDVEALFWHDVAAESKSEIVMCYPGITCMLHQRVAHEMYLLGAPNNVTRMLTEMAHSLTGIDIHPQTSIGHHFFVDHGTGVVIGATARIGNHVCIYQGVTLGAKSFPVDAEGKKIKSLPRHPIIEDRVTIYSNAVILGRITVGRNSTIAGNSWVTSSVPPNSTVVQKATKVLKDTTSSEALFQHADGAGI